MVERASSGVHGGKRANRFIENHVPRDIDAARGDI
jgi:hypothetical protein